jgi:hypothetical protein
LTVEACLGGKSITLSRFAQKIPRAISKKHEFPARHYVTADKSGPHVIYGMSPIDCFDFFHDNKLLPIKQGL